MTDALGNLVRFVLPPGHRFDTIGVAPLIKNIAFDALLADKAFDSNWIIEEMNQRGEKIMISQRPQRIAPLDIDAEIYKWRHLIENFFAKLKEFKGIAKRSEKTDRNFSAHIDLCLVAISVDQLAPTWSEIASALSKYIEPCGVTAKRAKSRVETAFGRRGGPENSEAVFPPNGLYFF